MIVSNIPDGKYLAILIIYANCVINKVKIN